MSKAWTRQDPGAGSLGSLRILRTQLGGLESALDAGALELQRTDNVFDSDWVGAAAEGAQAQVKALVDRADMYESAIAKVKKALGEYIDEVSEIKKKAAIHIADRNAAFDQIQQEQIFNPDVTMPQYGGASSRALDEATAGLTKLATRRQEADSLILETVRTAVATTWDVPPKDYPSERNWFESDGYPYRIDDPLGFSVDDYTAEELMEYFKKYPSEIFPFPVSGPSTTFKDGTVFTLTDMLFLKGTILPYETGVVVVTTTLTSVKFTVVSDEYFDGPGSTIEFSMVEKNGEYVLRKEADAVNAVPGAGTFGPAEAEKTRDEQAENFKSVIEKYGAR